MSNEELKRTLASLDRLHEKIADSPEEALAFLVRAGIATPDGELTAPYRQDA
jgi:hypothetical protein